MKKNVGEDAKAKKLYTQAIAPLKKAIDLYIKPPADVHYYLARAYYELDQLPNACREAKEAIRLAKGKHLKAEEIRKAIADCD